MNRVAGVGPDGAPITLPESQVGELEATGTGHVQTPQEAAAQDAHVAAPAETPLTAKDIASEYADTWLAGAHGAVRGTAEAFGVPLDKQAIGIADAVGGRELADRTRGALKGLEDRHPYTSSWMGMVGNVVGAVGGAELAGGNPAAKLTGVGGVAARAGIGGVENVVQATTRDLNEDALGDRQSNAEKLVAAMPKHFLLGAVLTGAFEGGAYALTKGIDAVAPRAASRLEEGANRAIGRDLGLEGKDAAEAGARIRELGQGEVPASRGAMEGLLEGEQAAQRKTAASAFEAEGEALAAAQRGEAETLAAKGVADVERAGAEGSAGVVAARAEAESGVGKAITRREEGLAAREGLAKGALEDAERGVTRAEVRRAATQEALERIPSEIAALAKTSKDVEAHYASVLEAMREEHVRAAEAVNFFAKQHAETGEELSALTKRIGDGADGAPGVRKVKRDALPRGAPRALTKTELIENAAARKAGLPPPHAGAPPLGKLSAGMRAADEEAAITAAESTGSEATVAEAQRLTAIREQIGAARKQAVDHLEEIEAAAAKLKKQGATDMAAAELAATRMAKSVEKRAPVASRQVAAAETAVEVAKENVKRVERESAAFIEAARSKGDDAVTKATARGEKRIASARADAEAAVANAKAAAEKDAGKLASAHEKARTARGEAPTATTVDAFLAGAQARSAKLAEKPMVSGTAGLATVLSLVHGNPLGAASALIGSFAAGAARNAGNIAAARTMVNLSRRISAVNEVIRRGAASLLGHAGAVASESAERVVEERRATRAPKFEDVMKGVIDAQANPVELEQRVLRAVGHMSNVAPGTYAETLATVKRANDHLYSILPVPQRDPHSLTPHLESGTVPEVDQYEFMEAASAIDAPLDVFRHTRDGEVTENQIRAIQAVYPPLYNEMRNEVRRQTMYLTTPVDYERSVHIGTLLGVLATEVLEPQFQAEMRKSYEDKAKAGAPVGGSKAGDSGGESKLAKSMASASQSIEGGSL